MNRFEQRLKKDLQNPEVARGYAEMDAELALMHALDAVRKEQHLSQEQLAARIGRKREAVSRLFSADEINPTLGTVIEMLSALNLTVDITLRPSAAGESPMKLETKLGNEIERAVEMARAHE